MSALRSGDKPKPAALRFGSHQDALDYISHCIEDANSRLAAQNLNAVDRYKKGEVAAYVRVQSTRNGDQCHLVFVSVPPTDHAISIRHPAVSDPGVIGNLSLELYASVQDSKREHSVSWY